MALWIEFRDGTSPVEVARVRDGKVTIRGEDLSRDDLRALARTEDIYREPHERRWTLRVLEDL